MKYLLLIQLLFLHSSLAQIKDTDKLDMLAEQRNPEDQYLTGKIHYLGHGVPKDTQLARFWLTKAAEQQHVQAQFLLGNIYNKDDDLKNHTLAMYWYKQAAEQEYSPAQFLLGNMYQDVKAHKKALHYWERAANQGHLRSKLLFFLFK